MSTVTIASSSSSKIRGVLTNPVTAELSVLLMQKIVSISMSNIAYARRLCPNNSFKDREVHGVKMKILRDDCEIGYQIVTWLKGAFHALHKQYLRMLIFAIHAGSPSSPVLESYSYEFTYFSDDDIQCVVRSSSAASEDVPREYTVRKNIYCPEEIERMTKELFESCQRLQDILKPLPEEKFLTMKLLYYDEVTPQNYEPPGFEAAESSTVVYACEHTPRKYRVGFVSTPFHATKVRFQSTLVDEEGVTEVKEEEDIQQVASDNLLDTVPADNCPDTVPLPDTLAATRMRRVSARIMPLVPAQTLNSVATPSTSRESHLLAGETMTEQSFEQQTSSTSQPPCKDNDAVLKPRRKSARSCFGCKTHVASNTVSDAHATTKPRKRKQMKTSVQEDDQANCLLKKSARKYTKKKVGKKNAKRIHPESNDVNKENVVNLSGGTDDFTGKQDSGITVFTTEATGETCETEKGRTSSTANRGASKVPTAVRSEQPKKQWRKRSPLESSFGRGNKEKVVDLGILPASSTTASIPETGNIKGQRNSCVTASRSGNTEVHVSEMGESAFVATNGVREMCIENCPEHMKQQCGKQRNVLKSSVSKATINLMDVPSCSSNVPKKEISCACGFSEEFGLMILCKYCITWQHSVCYGIIDGQLDEVIEINHCCVQCASADGSRSCTDQILLQNKSISRTVCVFRRALQLCGQCSTITKTLLQRELELTDNTAGNLLTQLMNKGIVAPLSPTSTTFTVNRDAYVKWLGQMQRRS